MSRCRLLLALLAVALAAGPARGAAALRAGAARVSITPDPGEAPYPLGGYTAGTRLTHRATGVRDTCYARALVMGNATTRYALVSCELCFLPDTLVDAVTARVADLGLPASHVLLCATHTHSAADPLCVHARNTGTIGTLPKYDPRFAAWFVERIARTIREAVAAMRPASVGSLQVPRVGLNRNRRDEKLTDDEMTVLRVDGEDGRPIAAVCCYAAHPTLYGPEMLEVSGDWCGLLQQRLETALPGATALFINGSVGDAAPRVVDEGAPAERVARYAGLVADVALAAIRRVRPEPHPRLAAWRQPVDLPARRPHPLFLLLAGQFRASSAQARDMVSRLMPERSYLSFLRVGRVLAIGYPAEPTAVIGLAAKAEARRLGIREPMVVALTNGWLGYFVDAAQYRTGRVEPAMSFYGPDVGRSVEAAAARGIRAAAAGGGAPK
ncbi:MAG: neutral/alkaline non-lysosomal ceramidase N-terminal domain-containing protein [Chthonomonadales bacterium]|nr:neutral/alkaline non-lysosomal ceramidase N-terminal domain-containing protein [Chthonomonadales bacterium]